MANISPTIKVDISTNFEIVEEIMLGESCSLEEVDAYIALFQEFRDIFAWSYTKMPRLDPSIVEHHIDTWPNVAPVYQKKRPIHPSKVAAVKAEIEKLRTTGFHHSHFGWMDGSLLLVDRCYIRPCVNVVFLDGWI